MKNKFKDILFWTVVVLLLFWACCVSYYLYLHLPR